MVTRSRNLKPHLILILFNVLALSVSIHYSASQELITYTVNQEWTRVWINKDLSADVWYNITLTYISGSPEGIVTVGVPKKGFRIQYVRDVSNATLSYTDASYGDFFGIDVQLRKPIVLNRQYTFLVYAMVPDMVSEDKTNPGNVGMQFYPSTFSDTSTSKVIGPTEDVRVEIILPEGVKSNEVRYPTGMPFDNVFMEGTNLAVYWNRTNWPAAQELRVGVSFPANYVSLGPSIWYYVAIAGGIVAVVALVAAVFLGLRKSGYEKPRIAVEALGAARGLTAVEAGVVLDLKPVRVLTMILFGLLLKRVAMVTAVDPLIKLQKLERSESEPAPSLRYYEIDYLKALESDGGLDDMILARTYLELRDTVNLKLRGYSRTDTVNYYQSVVNKAWEQVSQAGTPELKGDAIDQNMDWLLADNKFDERLRVMFPPEIIIVPRPGWWWYWYGPRFPHGPTTVPPTTPTQPKPIPGQDFANNIVLSLEKSANNMVKNVQEFTNRLFPVQTVSAEERSVRSSSSCVCACAHCACACACVSCACACAHGGAR